MKHMHYIASGAKVEPIVAALEFHPELWNQHTARTEAYAHSEISDIWVRYNAFENFTGDREAFNAEHDSVWYPAADVLGVKPLIFDLMRLQQATRLGGVLITKIPPGAKCHPHIDKGWHATYYEKYAVQLRGDLKQGFHFEGESFAALPGDIYSFDNSQLHWVTNDSDVDRMTLIICMRRS